ncbi:peptide/nickel transport system permease protein [Quadrisphaera granulorum]|uniref:Peptide/nickel transport system permease protein n=1 Tax=Quadrisphaera granulorum TaxID=317664 RepID=A0A316A8N5_9ACTN|nr:ABC transporter permease [Quadrisphaera granulorum]PWJ53809.1 peptide/nickel transport system permease protein [Quadrisphaera granulorum]SZE96566.1 peptide/nickel transport system permease protein [Quadrisphaera granulorum]
MSLDGALTRRPRGAWLRLPRVWRSPLAVVGAAIAVAWLVVAVSAPAWVPYPPDAQQLPRLSPPGEGTLLGTDALGRDVFSRLMTGASTTIPLALGLVVASAVIGVVVGAVAGWFGGWVDEALMRLTDLVMAFPTVILAMVVAASLGPSLYNAVIAAVVVSWPQYARVTRSLVLGLRTLNYVVAGRLLGRSPVTSLVVDVAPNVVGPVVVLATLDVGAAVLLLSGLSFLGLGAQPPTAEWGSMISGALANFDAWWIGTFPGLAILTVVMAFNFLGDALRDAVDPTSRTERTAVGVASAPQSVELPVEEDRP